MKRKMSMLLSIILVTTSFIGCDEAQENEITPTTTPAVEEVTQDDVVINDVIDDEVTEIDDEVRDDEIIDDEDAITDEVEEELPPIGSDPDNVPYPNNQEIVADVTNNETSLSSPPSEPTTALAESTIDYNLHIKTSDGTVLENTTISICMNETSLQNNEYLILNESITKPITGDGVTVFSVPNRAETSDDEFMLTFHIDLGKPFSISTEANDFVPSVNGVVYAHSTDLGFNIDDKDLYITITDESSSTTVNASTIDYNLHIKTSDGAVLDDVTVGIAMNKVTSNVPVPAIGDPLAQGTVTYNNITSDGVTKFSVADMRTISDYDYELSFILDLGRPFSISTETNDFIASVDGEIRATSTELGFDIDDKDFYITITLH